MQELLGLGERLRSARGKQTCEGGNSRHQIGRVNNFVHKSRGQSRAGADGTGRLIGPGDLLDATHSAGDNFVVAKISYLLGAH